MDKDSNYNKTMYRSLYLNYNRRGRNTFQFILGGQYYLHTKPRQRHYTHREKEQQVNISYEYVFKDPQ